MKYLKTINEDFAEVGNTGGMGDVTSPTPSSEGSGDVWDLLGKPATGPLELPMTKKRKRRVRKFKDFTR